MKGNSMMPVLRLFSDSLSRWRELNNSTVVGKRLGWFVIGVTVAYISSVMLLSFVNSAGFPVLFAVILPFALFCVMSFVSKAHVVGDDCAKEWIPAKMIFVFVAVPYLVLAVFGWFASPDTQWQWRQVLGLEPFDDWHPVIHTALIYVAALLRKSIRVVVMVQVVVFSLLITWLYSTLRRYGYDKRLSYIVIVLAVANPFSTSLLRVPWKDTAFAMTGLAVTVCLINILQTKGAWLSVKRLAGVAVLLFLASFLRHNGFFYSLPLALILPFSVSRANRGRAVACVALAVAVSLSYVALKGHLIKTGVIGEKRQTQGVAYQGFVEAVGLPMCIMAESYVIHPEKTPPEVAAFLETLCDRDFWVKYYNGEFNTVKFQCSYIGNPTGPKIAAVGKDRFFKMFLATVKMNPVSAIKSFLNVTSQAWAPCPKSIGSAIAGTGTGLIATDINVYQQMVLLSPFGAISSAPGFYLLCMVLATCYGVLKVGFRVCVLSLPFICYQFGTMLFLTGLDYRFFYITVLSGGAVCLALFRDEHTSSVSTR